MTTEKFIMAGGCALRVRDSSPKGTLGEPYPDGLEKDTAVAGRPAVSQPEGFANGPAAGPQPEKGSTAGLQQGGLPVVLLHGYLESLDVWEDFQKELARHMRVVSLDLPGHGIAETKGEVHTMEFMARVVNDALDVLGIGRAVIVGHSMGGYVALEYLRSYPEAVAGIVLFHSTPNADSEVKKADREREINLILGGKKELIARMFPQVGFAPRNRRRLAEKIEELSDQITLTDDEGIVAALRGMGERRDLNEMLRNSNVPQLFIFGRHDEYIIPEIAEAIIAGQPQAKVEWLESSGHMGFLEEPEKSLQIILGFLDTIG